MFEKIAARVQNFVARIVAWQVNERYERAMIALLDQVHTGASLEWVHEIVEQRGRHALAAAHH